MSYRIAMATAIPSQHQQQQHPHVHYGASPELSPHRYQHGTQYLRATHGSEAGSSRNQHASPNFVNSFWGPNDAGYKVVHRKIKDAIATLNELVAYFEERLRVEMEYSKKLDKLNNKIDIGVNETGQLKALFVQFQIENMNMVKMNQNKFVDSVKVHNYEKLVDFSKLYQRATSKVFHHMNRLAQQKKECAKSVKAAQQKYATECNQMRSTQLLIQTTWGKELEKHQKHLAKLTSGVKQTEKNYQYELNRFKEVNDLWIRDWSIALKDIYTLEVERLQVCKIVCFNFLNNIATLCVDNDQSLDISRSSFAKMLPLEGIAQFTLENGTGNQIPREMGFIDYFNGFDQDNNSDNQFAIAKFEEPDHSSVLAKTYSIYSHPTPNKVPQQNNLEQNAPIQHQDQQQTYQQPPSPQRALNQQTAMPQTSLQYQPYKPKSAATKLKEAQLGKEKNSETHHATPFTELKLTPRTEAEFEQKLRQMGKTSKPVRFALDKDSNIPHFPAPKGGIDSRSNDYNGRDSHDGADIFSNMGDPLNDSGGSQPTNYTFGSHRTGASDNKELEVNSGSKRPQLNYSTLSGKSNGERTWSSPRRRASYISLVQDDLDSKYMTQLKTAKIDMTTSNAASAAAVAHANASMKAAVNKTQKIEQPPTALADAVATMKSPQRIPIMKDFSIDFIAKALEDLSSGGNGDITRFRRSVRRANEEKLDRDEKRKAAESSTRPKSMPPPSEVVRRRQSLGNLESMNSKFPPSDFINDSNEVAVRYGSLTFKSPARFDDQEDEPIVVTGTDQQGSPVQRYRSLAPPSVRQKTLLRATSKSYTDLHGFVETSNGGNRHSTNKVTPHSGQKYITKAIARYAYRPQESQELYFKKGWQLYVIHKQEDNWFFCELGPNAGGREGLIGLVPGNYVIEGDDLF